MIFQPTRVTNGNFGKPLRQLKQSLWIPIRGADLNIRHRAQILITKQVDCADSEPA